MGELRPWHIVLIVIAFFVLFGYKKLPDATRSLGRSLRILKTEVKSLHDDEPETPWPPPSSRPRAPSRRPALPCLTPARRRSRPFPPALLRPRRLTQTTADHSQLPAANGG